MNKIEGIISALITPMNEDESIDLIGLKKIINIMIDSKIHGIFLAGSAGECCSLNDDEKLTLFEEGMAEINGRIPVILGTGGINTKDAIKLSKRAEKLKPDALSIVTPFYVGLNQQQLFQHFKSISEEISIPILIYNIPQRTGLNITGETVARLAEFKNIIGIKDSWGDIENFKQYLKIKDFICLIGSDPLIYEALSLGAAGSISAYANVCPKLLVNIYEYYKQGNFEKSKAEQERFMPLDRVISKGCMPGPIKQAVSILKFNVGPARLPVTGYDGVQLEEFKQILASYMED